MLVPIKLPNSNIVELKYPNIKKVVTTLPDEIIGNILALADPDKILKVFENPEEYSSIFKKSLKITMKNQLPMGFDNPSDEVADEIIFSSFVNFYFDINTFNKVAHKVYVKVIEELGLDEDSQEDQE